MKTPKFIIENKSKVDDFKLFNLIMTVIDLGLISGDKDLYCYVTSFKNGTVIIFDKKKYGYKITAIYDESTEQRQKE